MGKGFLSAIAVLVASAGLVCGQPGPSSLSVPPGPPVYLPDPSAAVQPVGCYGVMAAPGAMMPPPPPSYPGGPGGCVPGYGPIRPLYSRNNAFGPREVVRKQENAFEMAQDHPQDLQNNAWAPSRCCCPWCWVDGQFLLWWVHKPLPEAIVTSGPDASQGVLGQPGTFPLFGSQNPSDTTQPGFRLTAGYWIDCLCLGIEASGLVLIQRATNFDERSDANGNPVLARPYFNITTGLQDRELAGFPGAFAGGITAAYSLEMWGAEANLVYNPYKATANFPEFLIGFRYLDLEEHLNIQENFTILANGLSGFNGAVVGPGNAIAENDFFQTRNTFYGGQVGVRFRHDVWFLGFIELVGKVALGNNRQVLSIDGSTTLFPAGGGAPQTVPGALLALTTNIGQYERNRFTAIPEFSLNVGVYVTDNCRAYIGYNTLLWPGALRAGNQVDPNVNANFHPTNPGFNPAAGGPARPGVVFREDNFWVHGLNVGVAVNY